MFGSMSRFNDLCHELVTKAKEKYPYIKRIYVRAEFPYINDSYKAYLLKEYEETYYPKKLMDSGRASYIKRNYEMIRNSNICVFYYDERYAPAARRSGTRIALEYAVKLNKCIITIK